jgi:hypothetical protein
MKTIMKSCNLFRLDDVDSLDLQAPASPFGQVVKGGKALPRIVATTYHPRFKYSSAKARPSPRDAPMIRAV